jgi:hypothetical protein
MAIFPCNRRPESKSTLEQMRTQIVAFQTGNFRKTGDLVGEDYEHVIVVIVPFVQCIDDNYDGQITC